MVCDGGFFVDIFDKLLLNDRYPMKSIFPLTTGHMLQHELDKVTKSEIREYQQTVYYQKTRYVNILYMKLLQISFNSLNPK